MKKIFFIFAFILFSTFFNEELYAQEVYRITAYDCKSYSDEVEKVTIKIQVTQNSLGQEEIELIAYMDQYGTWHDTTYTTRASKCSKYGHTDCEKQTDYKVYAGYRTVYFNL